MRLLQSCSNQIMTGLLPFQRRRMTIHPQAPYAYTSSSHHLPSLCKQGRLKEALHILYITDIPLQYYAFVSLLQACIQAKALPEGKLIHAHINQRGITANTMILNTLINMYVKCGNVVDARRVFNQMNERDECSWTVMIAAYSRLGPPEEALTLFQQMQQTGVQPNQFTFSSVLPACASLGSLEKGMEIHEQIINTGFQFQVSVANTLVDMYAKCGRIQKARELFDKMHERNVVSWTVMIAAYAKYGPPSEAIRLFSYMKQMGFQPNQFTFATVLPACGDLASLKHGVEIHEEIIRNGFQSDLVVANALVDMYAKCGNIETARDVFNKMSKPGVVAWTALISGYAQNRQVGKALELFQKMPQKNVVSWNAMIAGFAQNGLIDDALRLFKEMPQQDVVSWNTMIAGFAQNGLVDEALKLFQEMPERDVVSWNGMIAGYAQNGLVDEAFKLFKEMPQQNVASWNAMIAGCTQNGLVDEALKLFKQMPQQNVISWNAMIAGFAQNGHGRHALQLFQEMQLAGVRPDSMTFASILPVCANLAALEQGVEIHEKLRGSELESDIIVVNALIDMYAKCGCIQKARELFDSVARRDVVSWTTMITGYAMHGYGKEAVKLFEQMKDSGMNPDRVTLISVLSACSHAGLVDEGYRYFNCMKEKYHITPTMDHYSCMVDLLGRAGRLDEAKKFINDMPVKADTTVWSSLLGACRIHKNIELGESVAERIFELEPNNSAPYVLLSNIYGAAGRWDDIEKVRKMMKDRGVKKTPGCSWVEDTMIS